MWKPCLAQLCRAWTAARRGNNAGTNDQSPSSDGVARLREQVLATFADGPDRRLNEVMRAVVRHLHELVDEVQLTREEWEAAIAFLTAVGQMCSPERQEFILLSDTLGVSSLVEMINFAGAEGSTENTVLGPFYLPGSRHLENGASIVVDDDPGQELTISGTVRSLDGNPIAGATVDVWQVATRGIYAAQRGGTDNLRGVFTTDGAGRYAFRTVRPVDYGVPDDGPVGRLLRACGRHPMRAAHVHLIVSAPGYHPVTTHVFDAASPHLGSDAVFGVRSSLVRDFEPDANGGLRTTFDVVLSPAR